MSPLCSGLFLMVLSNYVSLRSYWCMTPTGCQLLHKRKVAILHKHTFVHTYTLVQENCTKPHSSFAHFKFSSSTLEYQSEFSHLCLRLFFFLAAQKVQDTLCNFFVFTMSKKIFNGFFQVVFLFQAALLLKYVQHMVWHHLANLSSLPWMLVKNQ